MPDLLIELLSEEIPARMQARARDDLKRLVTEGLVAAGLTYAGAGAFSTPRRLTLTVEGLDGASRPLREERKGPRADAPEAALEGFLRTTGLARDQLELRDDKKGQAWFAVIERPGRPAAAIVAEVLEAAIRDFPWPKSMRWGTGALRWVRPLQSILCLLSDEAGATVVPLSVDGIAAGASTEGHRFMAPGRFAVTSFDDYRARLQRAFVLIDSADREARIWHAATTAAFAQGVEVVPDPGLLAEVAGLVEWPVVLTGRIGAAFLDLPPEVLQTSMRAHQKFLSLRNPRNGRIEGFVTVANRETADGGATILAGNSKVLAARLSDARFFWENDLRTVQSVGMEGMAAGLANVTFHNRLGSQADRVRRIAALARDIAPLVGADPDLAEQAARVAKADLQSAMVAEFPELQGIMGGYYARAAGLPDAVAQACKAHYQPLGPSDAVPSDPVSVTVALADKIDTLTGFWAIDEKPTGSKDPFALRRAALGVIRLVLTNGLRLSVDRMFDAQVLRHQIGPLSDPEEAARLAEVLKASVRTGMYGDETRALVAKAAAVAPGWLGLLDPHDPTISDDLRGFLHDRLKVHLRDQGIRHDVIDAVRDMPDNCDLTLLVRRAEALSAFLATDEGANLLQGFRRANNILAQAEAKDGVEYSFGADPKFAETPEERALFVALDGAEAAIAPALAAEDFAAAMAALAALRAPVDAFFTAVQVNADNPILRRNRLNLLHQIRALCGRVADLSRIEG
jgi:glycyl-tRNA synthetase beta chain